MQQSTIVIKPEEIWRSNKNFQVTEATQLRRSGLTKSYTEMLEPIRDRVCNRKEKKVCCLSSSSPLPKLGREEQVLECQENPCRGELTPSIPWPGKEGCINLPADMQTSSCILVLHQGTDELECQEDDELGVRGVAVSAGRYETEMTDPVPVKI